MISFFPDIYPDELLYSQLARYYTKSGYTAYIFAAEDLYEKRTVKPDIEFLNPLTKITFDIITQNISWERVIKNHTICANTSTSLNFWRAINAALNLRRPSIFSTDTIAYLTVYGK